MYLPYDAILEIAKHCHYSALLSLSRTCHQFAAKVDKIETIDRNSISNKFIARADIPPITRCPIWRVAMEAQFPNKKHLSFYSDDLNYFIAKAKNLEVMINPDTEEITEIFQPSRTTNIVGEIMADNMDNIYGTDLSNMTDRFVLSLIYNFEPVGYYPSFKEAEAKCGDEICVIIDLKYTSITFKNETRKNCDAMSRNNRKFIYPDESDK